MFVPTSADYLPNIAVPSPSPLPARRAYRPEGKSHEPEAKTHFSNIPAFHHSNWGEAPNLGLCDVTTKSKG